MDAIEIKAEQAGYWRFIRQMPIVAIEALCEDVLVVSNNRQLSIIEIKVSAADMRIDRLKSKHADIRKVLGLSLLEKQHSYHSDPLKYGMVPNYFYFAIPDDLLEKAQSIRDKFYPYAGLIVVPKNSTGLLGHSCFNNMKAQQIHKKRLTSRP